MSFYMDNILIGSNPSTQDVTVVVSNQVMNDQVPLSKSNRAVPPGNIGVPLKNANYRIIENKNLPLHTVVKGTTDSVLRNNTKNMDKGGDELPFGNKAQLSLHRVILFPVGWKGTRILCSDENYADTLSFFGVHNAAVSESQLAIMAGTRKYTSAKGFAIITAITSTNHSIADEAKSLLRFSVFLA
ncbi:hypothetical protein MKW92_025580 [Papaver armeniacum]|nr:hypothetical protein MKW92_025580 [Papaver armeniacum]